MSEQKKRILLVADDVALIATLRDELEASGFAVEPVATSEEALRKIHERPPDVILLDLLLPGEIDGMGLLSRLKRSDRTKAIPIVVLSSVADEYEAQAVLDLGAGAIFRKTRHVLPDLVGQIQALLKIGGS